VIECENEGFGGRSDSDSFSHGKDFDFGGGSSDCFRSCGKGVNSRERFR
jgi:hypothetical protein